MLLVDSLQEDGWSIVFTVRNSSLGGLQDLIQNFLRLDTEILPIERLNSFELDKLLAANHLERPSDENLYDRIHNLFYLARFAELAFGGDLSYHQYRSQRTMPFRNCKKTMADWQLLCRKRRLGLFSDKQFNARRDIRK